MTETGPTQKVERVELLVREESTRRPRGKRLARGTIPPPVSAKLPLVPRPLAIKLIPPPRRWGRVVRVALEPTVAPARRVSPIPFAVVLLAAIAALAFLLATSTETVALAVPRVAITTPIVAEPTITPIVAADQGLVQIVSTPSLRIWIDGRDTGLVTPQELRLPMGRHHVTLVGDALEDHAEVIVGETPSTLARDLSEFLAP